MNLTATQVITRALRIAKVLGFDETPAAVTLNEGLLQLQLLLDRWKEDPYLHFPPDHQLPTFANLAATVVVPDGFAEPLVGSLAAMIASENGTTIDAQVARATKAGLDLRRIRLADLQVPRTGSDVVYAVGQCGGSSNVLLGP